MLSYRPAPRRHAAPCLPSRMRPADTSDSQAPWRQSRHAAVCLGKEPRADAEAGCHMCALIS